jgi:Baseplate J-like protein
MFQVDDEPIETVHVYVVREAPPKPSMLPIVISVLALLILVSVGVLSPAQQPVTRAVIRVPAVLLTVKTFTAQAPVIPTGIKTHPATTAHGVLTITNGSVISQTLPAGFIFITNSVSIATDQAVFGPAGNANGYGYAVVSAHAATPGKSGNIPALAIDTVEGSSIYVRNLTAFHGGRDAYSVKVVTAQDTQRAVITARHLLAAATSSLHYPCAETISSTVVVTWHCQFVTYHIPAYMHVSGVKIIGKNLLVAVWFVARPVHIWVK